MWNCPQGNKTSALVPVMAWCRQAPIHYRSQCCKASMLLYMPSIGHNELTHWGRDKMDAVSQTTFSNAFSWMKMYEFRLRLHWSLFLRFELTIFKHWFRWWLGAGQATSHYLNQWWLVYRRIFASLGLNELNLVVPYCIYKPNLTVCIYVQR